MNLIIKSNNVLNTLYILQEKTISVLNFGVLLIILSILNSVEPIYGAINSLLNFLQTKTNKRIELSIFV